MHKYLRITHSFHATGIIALLSLVLAAFGPLAPSALAVGNTNLVGYWNFDDPRGSYMDAASYSNGVTCWNAICPTGPGKFGNGLPAGQLGAVVNLKGELYRTSEPAGLTVATWFKIDQPIMGTEDVVSAYDSVDLIADTIESGYGIFVDPSNTAYALIGDQNTSKRANIGTLTPGTWHHLAFTWYWNTSFVTYLDGVQANSVASATYKLPNPQYVGMGNEYGSVDDVRIYYDALAVGDIAQLAAAIKQNDPPYINELSGAGTIVFNEDDYVGFRSPSIWRDFWVGDYEGDRLDMTVSATGGGGINFSGWSYCTPAFPATAAGAQCLNRTASELTTELPNIDMLMPANYYNTGAGMTIDIQLIDYTNNHTVLRHYPFIIQPVNDAPTFTLNCTTQTVLEDAPTQTVPNCAAGFSPGPTNEASQTLSSYVVTTNHPEYFSAQPSINTAGTLSYTLASDRFGSATVTVKAKDTGGTANNGIDTSTGRGFLINITQVNDPPLITAGLNEVVDEDAGLQTIASWAPAVFAGPYEEGLGQTFTYALTNSDPALFSVQPAMSTSGTLTYTPAPDANGHVTVRLDAWDNGGTANGGNDTAAPQFFIIDINPVNDLPAFTKGNDQLIIEDDGPHVVSNWATAISAGPTNELTQTLSFQVDADKPGFFSVPPAIASDGTLSYTAAANIYGSTTITIRLIDSGGTDHAGVDSSASQTFTITSQGVNDAPANTMPGPQILPVDDPSTFSTMTGNSILAADIDIESNALRLDLSAVQGTLILSSTVGLNFSSGDGYQDSAMSFTGTITDVNTALDGLVFLPLPDSMGSAAITMTVDDLGATGSGGGLSDTDTLSIDLQRGNQAPSITIPGLMTRTFSNTQTIDIPLDGPASVYPATIDVSDMEGEIRKVTVTLKNLEHTFPADLDILLVGPQGQHSLLMSDAGGAYDLQNLPVLTFDSSYWRLLTSLSLPIMPGRYRPTDYSIGRADSLSAPAPDGPYSADLNIFSGSNPNGQWQLYILDDFRDSDAGQLGGGWEVSITTATPSFTDEDTPLTLSPASDNALSVADADANMSPLELTLRSTDGTFTLGGDLSGLNFAVGDGTDDSTLTVSGPQDALNAAINILTFTPAANFHGWAQIETALSDGGASGAGGIKQTREPLIILVRPVIDGAPQVTPANTNEDTQSTSGLVISPNAVDGAEVTHFFVSSINAGMLFQHDGTTLIAEGTFIGAAQAAAGLRFTPAANTQASGSFQIQAALAESPARLGGSAATATITVNPINDAPTLQAISDLSVPISSGESSVDLAGISTGAADELDILSISATSSDPAFIPHPLVDYTSPGASGTLRFTPIDGLNGSATITVTITDNGTPAQSFERQFTVVVGQLNDPPTIDPIAEVMVSEDAGQQSITLTGLSGGPGGSAETLTIVATVEAPSIISTPQVIYSGGPSATLRFTPLANAYGTAQVTVRVTDNGRPPLTTVQVFDVVILPVNDAPSFVNGLNEVTDDGTGNQNVLLWAVRISAGTNEITQTVHFTIAVSNTTLFSTQPAVSSNGTLTFVPKRGTSGVTMATVIAEDDGGTERGGQNRSQAETFIIKINAANDPPTFTLSRVTVTMDEDFVGSQTITVIPDPVQPGETGQVVRYSLNPPSARSAKLNIDPISGKVSISALPDGFGTQIITVVANDGQARNATATQSFQVVINPIDDLPTLDALPSLTIAEDSGTQVVFLNNVTGGPLEGQRVVISASSSNPLIPQPQLDYSHPDQLGRLRFASALNQSGTATITIRVAEEATPSRFVERSIDVTVTTVNDRPVIMLPAKVLADASTATVIKRVSASDVDAGDAKVRTTLRVLQGRLIVSNKVVGGLTAAEISGNGTSVVVINSTLAALNATLADTNGFAYRTASLLPGFRGTDELTIQIDDRGNSGGPIEVGIATAAISIEPLADLNMTLVMRVIVRPIGMGRAATTGIMREYTLNISNDGPSAGTGVKLLATLPAGSTLESVTPSQGTCSGTSAVTCEIGTLAVGQQVQMVFVLDNAPEVGKASDLSLRLIADQSDPSPLEEGADVPIAPLHTVFLPLVQR